MLRCKIKLLSSNKGATEQITVKLLDSQSEYVNVFSSAKSEDLKKTNSDLH